MAAPEHELTLTARPDGLRAWIRDLYMYRVALLVLTRKDLQTRYKRATFGMAWAIAVPALQATIMALVFSHVVRTGSGNGFPIYVISGVVAFSYFSMTLPTASTSIVDGSSLTDKVWFPRALLPIVPCLSNLIGIAVTVCILVAIMPAFHVHYGLKVLLLLPATALLIAFTVGISLLTAALHVYFRDVRFIVQASLMVWIYATPVVYPQHLLGHYASLVDANPLTGIVTLFHIATVGSMGGSMVAVGISCAVTVILLVIASLVHSHHDRLFVDLL